jgi:hypothetical protein
MQINWPNVPESIALDLKLRQSLLQINRQMAVAFQPVKRWLDIQWDSTQRVRMGAIWHYVHQHLSEVDLSPAYRSFQSLWQVNLQDRPGLLSMPMGELGKLLTDHMPKLMNLIEQAYQFIDQSIDDNDVKIALLQAYQVADQQCQKRYKQISAVWAFRCYMGWHEPSLACDQPGKLMCALYPSADLPMDNGQLTVGNNTMTDLLWINHQLDIPMRLAGWQIRYLPGRRIQFFPNGIEQSAVPKHAPWFSWLFWGRSARYQLFTQHAILFLAFKRQLDIANQLTNDSKRIAILTEQLKKYSQLKKTIQRYRQPLWSWFHGYTIGRLNQCEKILDDHIHLLLNQVAHLIDHQADQMTTLAHVQAVQAGYQTIVSMRQEGLLAGAKQIEASYAKQLKSLWLKAKCHPAESQQRIAEYAARTSVVSTWIQQLSECQSVTDQVTLIRSQLGDSYLTHLFQGIDDIKAISELLHISLSSQITGFKQLVKIQTTIKPYQDLSWPVILQGYQQSYFTSISLWLDQQLKAAVMDKEVIRWLKVMGSHQQHQQFLDNVIKHNVWCLDAQNWGQLRKMNAALFWQYRPALFSSLIKHVSKLPSDQIFERGEDLIAVMFHLFEPMTDQEIKLVITKASHLSKNHHQWVSQVLAVFAGIKQFDAFAFDHFKAQFQSSEQNIIEQHQHLAIVGQDSYAQVVTWLADQATQLCARDVPPFGQLVWMNQKITEFQLEDRAFAERVNLKYQIFAHYITIQKAMVKLDTPCHFLIGQLEQWEVRWSNNSWSKTYDTLSQRLIGGVDHLIEKSICYRVSSPDLIQWVSSCRDGLSQSTSSLLKKVNSRWDLCFQHAELISTSGFKILLLLKELGKGFSSKQWVTPWLLFVFRRRLFDKDMYRSILTKLSQLTQLKLLDQDHQCITQLQLLIQRQPMTSDLLVSLSKQNQQRIGISLNSDYQQQMQIEEAELALQQCYTYHLDADKQIACMQKVQKVVLQGGKDAESKQRIRLLSEQLKLMVEHAPDSKQRQFQESLCLLRG